MCVCVCACKFVSVCICVCVCVCVHTGRGVILVTGKKGQQIVLSNQSLQQHSISSNPKVIETVLYESYAVNVVFIFFLFQPEWIQVQKNTTKENCSPFLGHQQMNMSKNCMTSGLIIMTRYKATLFKFHANKNYSRVHTALSNQIQGLFKDNFQFSKDRKLLRLTGPYSVEYTYICPLNKTHVTEREKSTHTPQKLHGGGHIPIRTSCFSLTLSY